MNSKNIKKLNFLIFFIFFIFILFVFDALTNSYIVLRENYDSRMIKHAGNCDKSGYGFNKKIYQKYNHINENIKVINFNGFPSSEGYFFKYKRERSKYLILIGSNKDKVQEFLEKDYTLIFSQDNCYLLSK